MSDPEKPIILVDLDEVLAGFNTAVTQKLVATYPDLTTIVDRSSHNVIRNYPGEYRDVIKSIIYEPGFFESLPLYDGAIEGLNQLIELGYDPQIASAPLPDEPRSIVEKRAWIESNLVPVFGSRILALAHITLDKHLIDASVLIDDRPSIPYSEIAPWKQVLFTQPYNKDIETNYRLDGWFDPDLPHTLKRAVLAHCEDQNQD
jgi:5'(3')-deoxyribonucleotidase